MQCIWLSTSTCQHVQAQNKEDIFAPLPDPGQRKTEGTFANGQFTATAKWDETGEPLPLAPAPKP